MSGLKLTAKDKHRFWDKVDVLTADECWEWLGSLDTSGYGLFRYNRKLHKAHRVSFQIANSKSPGKLLVCHSCDNPKCCNPNHLWLGTAADNAADRDLKGRFIKNRGSQHGCHILVESQVKEIKKGLENYSRGDAIKLAKKYNVSKSTIYNIKLGLCWKHV